LGCLFDYNILTLAYPTSGYDGLELHRVFILQKNPVFAYLTGFYLFLIGYSYFWSFIYLALYFTGF
jgi:hypothetical protein